MKAKIFKIIFIFFLTNYLSVAYAEKKIKNIMNEIDQLYNEKQYSESLIRYEEIFNEGYYTPNMLLKMALLKDINGDYTSALYYLEIYYAKVKDKRALRKMDEIAYKHNLKGYEYNDWVYFKSIFKKYETKIINIIIWVLIILFIRIVYQFLNKRKFGFEAISMIIILLLVFSHNNNKIIPLQAIIKSNIALMSAPSAGSHINQKIEKGNKIIIHNKHDIWYEIEWNNKRHFIRSSDILIIPEFKY